MIKILGTFKSFNSTQLTLSFLGKSNGRSGGAPLLSGRTSFTVAHNNFLKINKKKKKKKKKKKEEERRRRRKKKKRKQ